MTATILPRSLVPSVLAACGAGRTLHVGEAAASAVRAFRDRGVIAEGWTPDLDSSGAGWRLPFPDRAFDLVCAHGALDRLDHRHRPAGVAELLRVSRRALLVVTDVDSRDSWQAVCLEQACRTHPLAQLVVPYEGFDWQTGPSVVLFELLPEGISIGRARAELAATRDLHMDMLREAGRRADAHVARYMLARPLVRPGDRVLDAACGLGYGSAILTRGSLARSVLGLDLDAQAVAYAREHYGTGSSRLTFDTRDLSDLTALADGSFDVVVSFETLEHIEDPERFLADCRRILTPAGRLVCSVPNEWVDERGVDPNPHHLHVFNRDKLERLCRPYVFIEHVYGQNAGGGMKTPDAKRSLWKSEDPAEPAEWWLLVGMKDPAAACDGRMPEAFRERPQDDRTHALAFERDYDNPWLVRAMVTIGFRTDSPDLLSALSGRTLDSAPPASADAGAALCVAAYRAIERGEPLADATVQRVDRYCRIATTVPHVTRWQISLHYAMGLYWMGRGETARAAEAWEHCAQSDELAFSPLLSTKTVGAALLRGWLAAQQNEAETARHWWTVGLDRAERALHQPWDAFVLSRRAPVIFGLREAALIVDLASQCATGLHLLPQLGERPGILASQLFHSLSARPAEDTHERFAEAREARGSAEGRVAPDTLARRLRATLLFEREDPLPDGLRIAIFGAGSGGRLALERLRARGGQVDCFSDNDAQRHGALVDGVPVVRPEELRRRGVDVVAVASLPGRSEIFQQLAGLGFQLGKDFDAV